MTRVYILGARRTATAYRRARLGKFTAWLDTVLRLVIAAEALALLAL